ncbi:helix-hairpin-helix domain-containing protein [Candidatus Sumerlaeota bacterium]|nr:helix-hairpin-helix domain-containing protein [Candidatus Sumerlaeota bacterium]
MLMAMLTPAIGEPDAATSVTLETISTQAPSETLILDLGTTEPFAIDTISAILHDPPLITPTSPVLTVTSGTATSDSLSMPGDGETSGSHQRFISLLPPPFPPPMNDDLLTSFSAIIDGKVLINQATEEELQKVLFIDAERARAIVQYRAVIGEFRKAEDLEKVFGIDEQLSSVLVPKILFEPPPR